MMNKWLALRLFRQLPLVMSTVLALIAAYAKAQTNQDDAGLSLPQISQNIDIELDNIFQNTLSAPSADQQKMERLGTVTSESIQLVGVLIMGDKKLAWIKTHNNVLIELENGQPVPGSRFRIEQIFVDSVVLANIDTCPQDSNCKPMLVLDLN